MSHGSLVPRSLSRLLVALLALSFLGACSKEESVEAVPVGDPLPTKEVERGRKACQAYVARVCECAKSNAEMADECALAGVRPEALELNLDLAVTPGLSKIELQAVKMAARKIAAACFVDDGKLDQTMCPRPTP